MPGEKVEADRGYRGERATIRTPDDVVSFKDRHAKSVARARHETVNKRLNQFQCLKQVFRHDRRKHRFCFYAVAALTQLSIENGEVVFQTFY